MVFLANILKQYSSYFFIEERAGRIQYYEMKNSFIVFSEEIRDN